MVKLGWEAFSTRYDLPNRFMKGYLCPINGLIVDIIMRLELTFAKLGVMDWGPVVD